MNKEQLAQTIINNYFELIKVIDPSVLENDELLVEYLDILQAKVSEERNKYVEQLQEEQMDQKPIENEQVEEQKPIETESVEEQLEDQNEQTLAENTVEEEQLEVIEVERKTSLQDKINKLKEMFSIKRINVIGENIIKIVLSKKSKKDPQEELEVDNDIDMDYVNELAEQYLKTGQLVTLSPLSEKYSKAIGRRVQELKSSKEYIKEPTITPTVPTSYEEDEIFITPSTVPQTPTAYTPVPTVTMTKAPGEDIFITPSPVSKPKEPVPRPTQTPLSPSTPKALTEEDLIYIDKAARLYLEKGYLPTLGPEPPLFASEIFNRAKEIEKEESKSTELSDMYENNDRIVEEMPTMKK